MGIPSLAVYMRSRNIVVKVLDLSNEFCYCFLSPENIEKASFHAADRFVELNSQKNSFLKQSIWMQYGRVIWNILLHLVHIPLTVFSE